MSAAVLTPPAPTKKLPLLRRDIVVDLVLEEKVAMPSIVVRDPLRGSYYRLNWPLAGLFLHWSEVETLEQLTALLVRNYGLVITEEQFTAVVQFAFANQLTQTDTEGGWKKYVQIRAARKHGLFKTALHNYLFFRAPLIYPEAFLKRSLPYLGFFFHPLFWAGIVFFALAGLYFASRQWTALVSSFQDVLRLEGLMIYAAALLALKAIHEFGHALSTARFGCRVPSMGIAVMLGAPVFYTDTSDSWRLSKRRERLIIVFAGVAAEMIVATIAILAWSFLSDGMMRQICFAFFTTSVVLSLVVNLNPLMRFDGYYALSDWLGVPNLQSRGFNLMLWRLREFLFGLGVAVPVYFQPNLHRTVIIYSAATAVYRFFLFIGIAALVFVIAGKAIGIFLAAVEIGIFIIMPIFRELKIWWSHRKVIIAKSRGRVSLMILGIVLIILVLPWLKIIESPAVITAEREEAIYLPLPAKLDQILVSNGQLVKQGEILFIADSSDLDRQFARAEMEMKSLEFQMARMHASDRDSQAALLIKSHYNRAQEKTDSIARQRDQLVIRAPFTGRIADIDKKLTGGLWLNQKQPLARLLGGNKAGAFGLVQGESVERISLQARAVFVPDNAALPKRDLRVKSIAPASDGRLSEPSLADRYGGQVAVGEKKGEMALRSSWFEVRFETEDEAPPELQRGIIRVEATPISPLQLAWRQIAKTFVREHTF